MGLGKGESWDVGKPKSRKKTNDAVEETGCWVRLRSIGSCAVFLQDLNWIALLVASVLIVIDKNALKFKTKPLEHMELMRRVYEGATATGKFAWTPGAAFEPMATEDNPLLVDEEDCEDSSGLPLSSHPRSMDKLSTIVLRKRRTSRSVYMLRHRCTIHSQRKKGQSVGASLLVSSMENLASSVKLQQREVRVHHEYGDSASDCIRKCMARLYSLQGLDRQDQLILYGMSLMDNPANQAILLQLPTDADVIIWL
ncbi:unnamed protein product [Camellia sinensis]